MINEKYKNLLNSKNIGFIFIFLLIFLSGCDLIGVSFFGANIRLLYVFSFMVFIYNFRFIDVSKKSSFFLLIWFLLSSFSLFNSFNVAKGVFSLLWMLLNYLFLISLIVSIVKRFFITRNMLYGLVLYVYRVQLIIGFLLVLFGVNERVQAFYYEPSYMSISLSIYVSIVFHEFLLNEIRYFDIALILLFLIMSFSANFIIVVLLFMGLFFVRFYSSKYLLVLIFIALLGYFYVEFVDDINTTVLRGVLNGSADISDVLNRGGNRLSRFLSARDVFISNPWFGVGLSSYEDFSLIHGITDYSHGVDYLSAVGLPPVNIYIEVLATIGIIGFSGFASFWLYYVRLAILNMWSPFSSAFLVMLLVLNLESNFLRPYLWLSVGLLLSDIWLKNNEKNYI